MTNYKIDLGKIARKDRLNLTELIICEDRQYLQKTKPISDRKTIKINILRNSEVKTKTSKLISLYIPANFKLSIIIKQLEQEKLYVKKKVKKCKKQILNTLDYIIEHINKLKPSYKRGLVIFSGYESKEVLGISIITPIRDLNLRLYRCDKEFLTSPFIEKQFRRKKKEELRLKKLTITELEKDLIENLLKIKKNEKKRKDYIFLLKEELFGRFFMNISVIEINKLSKYLYKK